MIHWVPNRHRMPLFSWSSNFHYVFARKPWWSLMSCSILFFYVFVQCLFHVLNQRLSKLFFSRGVVFPMFFKTPTRVFFLKHGCMSKRHLRFHWYPPWGPSATAAAPCRSPPPPRGTPWWAPRRWRRRLASWKGAERQKHDHFCLESYGIIDGNFDVVKKRIIFLFSFLKIIEFWIILRDHNLPIVFPT